MSRLSARDLVDELARIAEIARKQGPVGLEKSTPTSRSWPRASATSPTATISNSFATNLERDRDNFLMHLDEGSKIYRAIGDCAPAFA